MRVAVMQPYLFPYIGYFQLVDSVDKFVIYDDVTFIKQGWINRNNILLNGKPFLFTVPLLSVSSYTLIKDTEVSYKQPWASKLLRTLEQAYKKAPYYSEVFSLITSVLNKELASVGTLAVASIEAVNKYLGINTEITPHSDIYNNASLSGQSRVIDICKQEQATAYHNPSGGKEMYSKADFALESIDLKFIQTPLFPYKQFNNEFVPWLSIMDVLMFNEPVAALRLIRNYELV